MQKKQRIPKNIKEQRTKKAKGASAYDEALYFLTPKARTVREVENRLILLNRASTQNRSAEENCADS